MSSLDAPSLLSGQLTGLASARPWHAPHGTGFVPYVVRARRQPGPFWSPASTSLGCHAFLSVTVSSRGRPRSGARRSRASTCSRRGRSAALRDADPSLGRGRDRLASAALSPGGLITLPCVFALRVRRPGRACQYTGRVVVVICVHWAARRDPSTYFALTSVPRCVSALPAVLLMTSPLRSCAPDQPAARGCSAPRQQRAAAASAERSSPRTRAAVPRDAAPPTQPRDPGSVLSSSLRLRVVRQSVLRPARCWPSRVSVGCRRPSSHAVSWPGAHAEPGPRRRRWTRRLSYRPRRCGPLLASSVVDLTPGFSDAERPVLEYVVTS